MIGAALGALLVTTLGPVPTAVAAAPEAEAAELSEGQKALAQAKATGKRVEVLGERSERTTVFANPDGNTFTLRESSVPVRVAKPGGGWQAPDATLEKRADGSIVPKAAAPQIAFSGGGVKQPLARIAQGGRSLELSWPGALPAPKLEGASAVYANVLPDVDLKITATVESFQHVLVVKTPKAAASQKLRKLTFGLKTKGVKVQEGAAGNLAAVDANGTAVFKAPPARMWNSAGSGLPSPSAVASERSVGQDTVASDPAEAAPSGSGLEPGRGDEVATMGVEVGKDSLSILPDAQLLAEKDTAAFPLFIDPNITWGESERTLLRSDGYESYGWTNGDDDMGKGAGKCGTWNNYYCGPGYVQRLYYEFSPASLKGKHVLDATFRVTEPWAFQCDPRWVDLVRTNNISSSTTWSTRPKELDWMGDRHVSAGRGDLCSPGLPNAAIEFNDNPDESDENLTPTVRDFAAGKFSRLTLEIRAHDESDTSAWKRFRNDAVLDVDFVGLPDKPTGHGIVAGSGTVCSTSESNPSVVSDPTPALKATPQTKPGGEKEASLRIFHDVDYKSGTTWVDAPPPGGNSLAPSSGYVGDGKAPAPLNWASLKENTLYRYQAWTWSYYNNYASHLSSTSTSSCYFKVDSSAPKIPQVALSSPYTACVTDDCVAKGGPGQKATFTFSPNAADTNVVAYEYKLPGQTAWTRKTGKTVTVDYIPPAEGTYTVYVHGVDSVGSRPGADAAVSFRVAPGDGPVARYHFDEADGAALDAATGDGKDDATLAVGAARENKGRRGLITHDAQGNPLATPVDDKGLTLGGTTGYAQTSGPVVETRASYTVSAWARLEGPVSGNKTVLGQDGGFYSGFYLSYQSAPNTWTLRMSPKDATDGNLTDQVVVAKQPAVVGAWTHLAVVYDAPTSTVSLYVNGVLQGSDTVATPWAASGPLQIGRVLYRGSYTDHFAGSIDEVSVWQQALTAKQVRDEARLLISEKYAGVELVGDFSAARAVPGTRITGILGRCIDVQTSSTADGTPIQIHECNGTAAQGWERTGDVLRALGRCATVNGVLVQLAACDGSAQQTFTYREADKSLFHPATGKCLDVPNSNPEMGTDLQVYECNASEAQQWTPDANSVPIQDTLSGYGKRITLTGGAAVDNEGLVLDGVDDTATVPGPIVDDTGSFTVTAAATLDAAKLLTKDIGYIGQVAGQRTADGSAWGLWFQLTGKKTVLDEETLEEVTVPEGFWHFGRLESDGTLSSVKSEQTASTDSTVRLTGVHDAVDGTISLYVGYEKNGDDRPFTARTGSGDFTLGRAYATGAWKHFLPARIAEVRLWSGAMASSDQVETVVGD
ncbi:LamG-like jellyroll fold domain-containing protein [Streptomyces indicus]|uniref:Concanavalin A-like lectin/glucanases superfamily protein n=1 Tax=Streptomyces indicus TaxID=417292 RepID=A0A1G9JQU4_9ACTN|nr:LamG-like jellyroll fold domain-containing protein [Streptomyces indicus]SDL39504.1 Concanavalin A-like lectin/glucanases superfamily protein [Streptomyces indicus]